MNTKSSLVFVLVGVALIGLTLAFASASGAPSRADSACCAQSCSDECKDLCESGKACDPADCGECCEGCESCCCVVRCPADSAAACAGRAAPEPQGS